MARPAKLEGDSSRPNARGPQEGEGRAPYGCLRAIASLELPPKPQKQAVQAQCVAGPPGPVHAQRHAIASVLGARPKGCHPGGRSPAQAAAVKGDLALPRRLPANAVWTVVDTYETDGKQYAVVRRDDVASRGHRALSRRESQALGLALLGHSNKVIAYEMGASASTVGVLLHRAGRKLGSRTRAELLAGFLGLAANEGSTDSPYLPKSEAAPTW